MITFSGHLFYEKSIGRGKRNRGDDDFYRAWAAPAGNIPAETSTLENLAAWPALSWYRQHGFGSRANQASLRQDFPPGLLVRVRFDRGHRDKSSLLRAGFSKKKRSNRIHLA